MIKILEMLEEFSRLLRIDPLLAADKLDEIANLLKSAATDLRTISATGIVDGGGMGDSCRLRKGSPDGTVTETTARG